MRIHIKFTNDNGEVLAERIDSLSSPAQAEGVLERTLRDIQEAIGRGELCEDCWNTGKLWTGRFDDVRLVTCHHILEDEAWQEADSLKVE